MKSTPLVLAVLAISGAAGCKKTVNHEEFETFVTTRVTAMGLTPGKVSCPSDIEGKAGNTFVCTVPIEKWSYDLKITITSVENDRAQMDTAWVRGASLLRHKLEEGAKKLYENVDAHCGDEPLIFLVDGKASCTLAAGKTVTTVTFTYDDKLVVTNTKFDPPVLSRVRLEGILEPEVGEQLKTPVELACGADAIIVRPADGFVWCDLTAGDKHGRIRATVTPDLDVTHWDIPTD